MRGQAGPESLFGRLDVQRNCAVNRGELGRYLVTFIDNHDSFWQGGRFAHQSSDNQVIGAIGFLLCALGTACIYYGTEQGFEGHGGDNEMREAMFDKRSPGSNLLNTNCSIYKAISEIAAVMRPSNRFASAECITVRFQAMLKISGFHLGQPTPSPFHDCFTGMKYWWPTTSLDQQGLTPSLWTGSCTKSATR